MVWARKNMNYTEVTDSELPGSSSCQKIDQELAQWEVDNREMLNANACIPELFFPVDTS